MSHASEAPAAAAAARGQGQQSPFRRGKEEGRQASRSGRTNSVDAGSQREIDPATTDVSLLSQTTHDDHHLPTASPMVVAMATRLS